MKTPARPSEDEANINSGAAKKDIALDVPFRRESVAAGGEEETRRSRVPSPSQFSKFWKKST